MDYVQEKLPLNLIIAGWRRDFLESVKLEK